MSRGVVRFFALALALGITGSATAHHPPLMERCVILTLTGQIELIEWRMPHVELFVRTDGAVQHRLSWLNVHQLGWVGIERDTLRVGDQVTVTVTTRRDDVVDRPMLLSSIRRISDGWEWSQDPPGC